MKKILYICSAIAASSILLSVGAMDHSKTNLCPSPGTSPGMVVAQSCKDNKEIHIVNPPLTSFFKTGNDIKESPESAPFSAYGFDGIHKVRLNSDGTCIVYGFIDEKICLKHIDLYKNKSKVYNLDGLTENIDFIKHPNGFSYICGEYKKSDLGGRKIIIYDENQVKIIAREIVSLQNDPSFCFSARQILIDYSGRLYLWGMMTGYSALFEIHQKGYRDIISISEKKIPRGLTDFPLIPKNDIPGIIYLQKRNLIAILQEDGTFSKPANFELKTIRALSTLYPNPNPAVYLYGLGQNDKPLIVKVRKDASTTRIHPFEVGITTIDSVKVDLANILYITGIDKERKKSVWVVRDDCITNCFRLESGCDVVPLIGYETIQPLLRHYKPTFLNTSGGVCLGALKNLCDDIYGTLQKFTHPGFSNEDNQAFYNLFLILSREVSKTKNIEDIATLYDLYTKLHKYKNSPLFGYLQILEYELFGGKETFLQNDPNNIEHVQGILEAQRKLQLAIPLMPEGLREVYLKDLAATPPPLGPLFFSDSAMDPETDFGQPCLKPGMIVVQSHKILKGGREKGEPEISDSPIFTFLDNLCQKHFEFTLKHIDDPIKGIYLTNKEIHIIELNTGCSLSSIFKVKNGEVFRNPYGSTSHNIMVNPLKLNPDGAFIVYSFINQKQCLQHIDGLYEKVSRYDIDGLTNLQFIKHSNGRSYVAGEHKEGGFELRVYDENQDEIKNLRKKIDSNLCISKILMDYNSNLYLYSTFHLYAINQEGDIIKKEDIPTGRFCVRENNTPGIIYFTNGAKNLITILQEDKTFSKPDNFGFKKIGGSASTLHPSPNPAVYFYGPDQNDKPLIVKVCKDASTTRIQPFEKGAAINSMAVDSSNTLYIGRSDQNSKQSIWVVKDNGAPVLFYLGSESAKIVGIQPLIGYETIQPLLRYHKPLLHNEVKDINLDTLKCLSDDLCKTLKTFTHPGFSSEDNMVFYDLFLGLSRDIAETKNIEGIKILYGLYTRLGEYRKSPMSGYAQILEYELFGGLDRIYKLNTVVTEEKILQNGLNIECFQRTLEAQRRLQLATSLISGYVKEFYLQELQWITDATTKLPGRYKK